MRDTSGPGLSTTFCFVLEYPLYLRAYNRLSHRQDKPHAHQRARHESSATMPDIEEEHAAKAHAVGIQLVMTDRSMTF
jgi:hypothetical protein